MSGERLPAARVEPGLPFDDSRPTSPMVRRGLERLASQQAFLIDPPLIDRAIIHFSTEFVGSVRSDLSRVDAATSVQLSADHDMLSWSCLYAAVRGAKPFSRKAVTSVKNATRLILEEPRYWRQEAIVFQLVEDLIGSGNGKGFKELYAHLDHHLYALRWRIHEIAWLVRSRLRARPAASHLLWNAAVVHGGWEESLALLLNLSGTEERFWEVVDTYLRPEWDDHLRFAILMRCLNSIRDDQSEEAKIFRHPERLTTFEREVRLRVEDYVSTLHIQRQLL